MIGPSVAMALAYICVQENFHIHKVLTCLIKGSREQEREDHIARKLFDKFTSEISPCYENNMKSYIAFILDEKFSCVPRSRLLTGEISVTGIMFSPYEHNFPA
jgi:hypothetical protein